MCFVLPPPLRNAGCTFPHPEDVMSRSLSYLYRGLLGIVFVGSLGFGASQALAAPSQVSQQRWCSEAYCDDYCGRMGWDGQCTREGACECY